MKKIRVAICLLVLAAGVSGCGKEHASTDRKQNIEKHAEGTEESGGQKEQESSGLRILTSDVDSDYCNNEAGYYYITWEPEELKDGSYAGHLMYMDFATRQEVYLCSDTGCSHDTQDCTSVLLYEANISNVAIFCYGESLYLVAKGYDQDGAVSIDYQEGESLGRNVISPPPVLYRMNLDGTKRSKVYEFDADLVIEDKVFGDDSGLYFVTKKLETTKKDNTSYTSSSERNLVKLDPASGEVEAVCSLEGQEENSDRWRIIGCFDDSLVLENTLYEKKLSQEEEYALEHEQWVEYFEDSTEQITVLNLKDGSAKVKYSVSNQMLNSIVTTNGMLYAVSEGENQIRQIDLRTGEETVLAELEENSIWYVFNDVLCCHAWEYQADNTWFVNRKDGTVNHSTLANKSGYGGLNFKGETKDYFLVIYDCEATDFADGSYEVTQNYYGLIAKEDLYQGNDNYLPIQMISKGE